MTKRLNILGINGSATRNSSNLTILKRIAEKGHADFGMTIFNDLTWLPHFKTEQTNENIPPVVVDFRKQIERSDGIIISTPEYIFSIPSRLKNAIEWCVSSTVFSDKFVGVITASANGERAHAELQLIMQTIKANMANDTTLLIQGVKRELTRGGASPDSQIEVKLDGFVKAFIRHIRN